MRAEERIVEDALGDEGEAHAVDDHADDRLEAVDVRDDVVLGEVKADLGVEEDAGARALLSKNPALARELLPGRDALCETVALGRHHDHFVGNPRLGDEVRIRDGALDDRDVGREVEERFGHLGGVGDEHFGHPARVRLKVAHQVREHEGADRERAGKPELARRATRKERLDVVGALHELVGGGLEASAFGRKKESAAGALEERDAEAPLKLRQGLAHRALAHRKILSSNRQVLGAGDCKKDLHLAKRNLHDWVLVGRLAGMTVRLPRTRDRLKAGILKR